MRQRHAATLACITCRGNDGSLGRVQKDLCRLGCACSSMQSVAVLTRAAVAVKELPRIPVRFSRVQASSFPSGDHVPKLGDSALIGCASIELTAMASSVMS